VPQYADIVEIVAPASAAPGSRVNVTARIKNLYSDIISIMVGGAIEYGSGSWQLITFPEYWANVGPGETYSFNGYFDMLGQAVIVHIYSNWYGSDGQWYFDDEGTKAVALMELRYEFDIGTPAVSAA
jgi:hypothetical protein